MSKKDVHVSVLIDDLNNDINKGAGTPYLNIYETTQGVDEKYVSKRIFIETHNAEIVEIDDAGIPIIDLCKKASIQVGTHFNAVDFNPKLLFMVRKDGADDKITNPSVISQLKEKFVQELSNGLQPEVLHVTKDHTEFKLYPFVNDHIIFSTISLPQFNNMTTVKDVIPNLADEIMKKTHHTFQRVYNLVNMEAINYAELNKHIAEILMDFSEMYLRLLVCDNKCVILENDINVIKNLSSAEIAYTDIDLRGYGRERKIQISMRPNTGYIKDNETPVANFVITPYAGNDSIQGYVSGRVSSNGRVSDIVAHGNDAYGYPMGQLHNDQAVTVKGGMIYRVFREWSGSVSASPIAQSDRMYISPGISYSQEREVGALSILRNGERMGLSMTWDDKGGKLLHVLNSAGSIVNTFRSEATGKESGYPYALRYTDAKSGIVGVFNMSTTKVIGGINPVLKVNGTSYYPSYTHPYAIYDQIRFSCTSWATKDNYGTHNVYFYDYSGREVHRIEGNPVFATWSSNVTYNIPKLNEIKSIKFRRFIDTSSDGGAHLNVDIYSAKTGWRNIIYNYWYRTGKRWEECTIDVNIRP
ncbi:MAG: hypothetical protein ACRC92_20450 [Peptostreptococcaceae bacterium]